MSAEFEKAAWLQLRRQRWVLCHHKAAHQPLETGEQQHHVRKSLVQDVATETTTESESPNEKCTSNMQRFAYQRRRNENIGQSELIFMQNKLPADFAITSGSEEQQQQEQSSEGLYLGGGDQPARSGNLAQLSIPAGIPNSSMLEHIATSRFFHHYVSPTRTFFRLDLDFTHSVINGASKRAILAEAIIAMGILTLPNKTREARTAARLRHTRALRLTNKALQDSQYVMSDEMLMAVILLGLYETTPDASHSITSWTSHLDGARHLLRIRGQSVCQAGSTYRLFNVLRGQILLNCFMSMQRMPQDLLDLSNAIRESQTGDERAASDLIDLFARMCNMVASSRDSRNLDVSQTIADATALDTELTTWAANAHNGLEISVQPAPDTARAYSDTCEVFSSIYAAEVWIIYRTARFGVNSLLASLYTAIMANDTAQVRSPQDEQQRLEKRRASGIDLHLQECASLLQTLKVDMCSTVPFLLERHSENPRSIVDLPLYNRTAATNMVLFLMRTQGTSEKMYNWAQDVLIELQAEEDVDKGAIWMNNPSPESAEQVPSDSSDA